MTGPIRMATGGEIDRAQRLRFRFDGQALEGYAGDTIASALLAAGVTPIGRSFKYHRPRGLMAASHEEANAVVDLRHGSRHDPNARATLEPLADGMELKSVHAAGNARRDWLAPLDLLSRFIPAAFYYKTFLWPHWHRFEPGLRAMSGLGRIDPAARARSGPHRHLKVDVCVVGAGAAGLAAAITAQRQGRSVLLVEQRTRVGGALLWRTATIDGAPGAEWAAQTQSELERGGARVMTRTTAFGAYDHGSVTLWQRGADSAGGEQVWQVHAREIIVASGAIERPLLFADNDRPGVMLADATLEYLRRYAVRAGTKVVIGTGNDTAQEVALALAAVGAQCTLVDARPDGGHDALREAGVEVVTGRKLSRALGRSAVQGVMLDDGTQLDADLVAMAGGWTPLIHLYCQARGKPRWNEETGIIVPGKPVPGMSVAGAANGARNLVECLQQGVSAAGGKTGDAPQSERTSFDWGGLPDVSQAFGKRRAWVDLQHDVTAKDIALAARENFVSVEHLKRYTTLGMAGDQGRTSNINGLAVLAHLRRDDPGGLGLTTFRPPFLPVPMAAIAGEARGALQSPIRQLPAERCHRDDGACLFEYGNTLRPAWYGEADTALQRECRAAREAAVILDASSLGKIEVMGPAAADLLDFVFYTRMSTLAEGRLRYGLALGESGAIFDDSVVMRLGPRHFLVSCSSSHVGAMAHHLEAWREDRFDLGSVFIHDATPQWATFAVSGPQCRAVLNELDLGVELDDDFTHMSLRDARYQGRFARIARVSFTGERSYEVTVPATLAADFWRAARAAGANPLGVEALGILRCEKGYIYVGQDTDSETQPQDIGWGKARETREDAYVGDRSLFLPAATRPNRRQLVGIAAEGGTPLPVGAHALGHAEGRTRSIGHVSSSYWSRALDRPIALAQIEAGASRMGERLEFECMGVRRFGRVRSPCFYDPEGARLHA